MTVGQGPARAEAGVQASGRVSVVRRTTSFLEEPPLSASPAPIRLSPLGAATTPLSCVVRTVQGPGRA